MLGINIIECRIYVNNIKRWKYSTFFVHFRMSKVVRNEKYVKQKSFLPCVSKFFFSWIIKIFHSLKGYMLGLIWIAILYFKNPCHISATTTTKYTTQINFETRVSGFRHRLIFRFFLMFIFFVFQKQPH